MTERNEEIEQFPVQKRQIHYEAEPEMKFFDVDEDPGEADFIRVDDLFLSEAQEEPSEELASAQSAGEYPRTQPGLQEEPAEIPAVQPAGEPSLTLLESITNTPEEIPPEQPLPENIPWQRKAPMEVPAGGAKWFTLFPQRKDSYIDSRLSRILRRTLLLTAYRLEKPIEKIRIRPQFIQWFMELSPNDDMEAIIREFRDTLELQAQNLLTVNLNGLFLSDTCVIQPAEKEMSANETIRAVSRYQEGQEKKEGTQK